MIVLKSSKKKLFFNSSDSKHVIIFSLTSVIVELLAIYWFFLTKNSCKRYMGLMLLLGSRNWQLIWLNSYYGCWVCQTSRNTKLLVKSSRLAFFHWGEFEEQFFTGSLSNSVMPKMNLPLFQFVIVVNIFWSGVALSSQTVGSWLTPWGLYHKTPYGRNLQFP